jgi:predicted glycosyltransferase
VNLEAPAGARGGLFGSPPLRYLNRSGDRSSPLRIWIDLANSPHALLFAPLARRLEANGHRVLVTVRDHAQTADLARMYWPTVTIVGSESPARPTAKAATVALRVRDLAHWARHRDLDVAVSHNSYAQVIAARLLGIRVVTAADFEHQPASQLAFRLADRILLPDALRGRTVERQGAAPNKTVFYPGLKEELYIGDFEPDRAILSSLGIERSPGEVVVVARTAPTRALYHRFSNPLFIETLRVLENEPNVRLVVLPRHAEQRQALSDLHLRNCVVPAAAIDARSLMYAADLVIGAGGTMVREAAFLGIPAFSLFHGPQPAVDRWLEQRGMLCRIRSPEEAVPVRPRPCEPQPVEELARRGSGLMEVFLRTIETPASHSLAWRSTGRDNKARRASASHK